eukprot:2349751-Lingulodinium_polyedra.AAC.1
MAKAEFLLLAAWRLKRRPRHRPRAQPTAATGAPRGLAWGRAVGRVLRRDPALAVRQVDGGAAVPE